MPKRLSTSVVKDLFTKYGYTVPYDFTYKNNTTKYRVYDEMNNKYVDLSLKQLQYMIKKGRSEYNDFALYEDLPMSDIAPKDKPINRKLINTITKELISKMKLAKGFTYNVNTNKDNVMLYALMYAIKAVGPKVNKDIRITLIDDNNNTVYYHGNQNTVNFIYDMINSDGKEISDSNTVALDTFKNIRSIRFEFKDPKNGKHVTAGFFPYTNASTIDLTKYGVFNDISDSRINESCLIQSFIASDMFTANEINMLKSFINTRTVPLEQLKHISDILTCNISVRYMANKGFTHRDYGHYDRLVKLIIIDNHYMLNDYVDISMYDEANVIADYVKDINRVSIYGLITVMKRLNMLIPMDVNTYNKLCWSYVKEYNSYNSYRPIVIHDKKRIPNSVKRMRHSIKLFGYDISDKEIDYRLKELQGIIASLGVKLNVRDYYRYSDLMLKVMYEYGCFDNVYELSGSIADSIRSKCVFPKTIYHKGHLTGKYYYIDLNGAYMSSVTSIPTGIPNDDLTFSENNYKIKELIEKLYDIRTTAKNNSNDKLATTIKFMMNSCWGSSIKKPNNYKKKYTKDVNKYIDEYEPYVIKYDDNSVYTVNSYREHYTYPQFAKCVLDSFNNKMDAIKGLIHKVYYSKVDSLLIDENDYNILKDKGFIGNALGQFKIEHVFAEVYIKSANNYIGRTLDNKYIYHVNNKYREICERSVNPIKRLMEL